MDTDTERSGNLLKTTWLFSGRFRPPILVFQVQLILIIRGLRIDEFVYLFKFTCNPKINTPWHFSWSFTNTCRVSRNKSGTVHTPGCGRTRWHSASSLQLSYYKHALSEVCLVPPFSILVLLLVLLLFEIAPKYRVEVQSTLPKLKKALMCPTKKNPHVNMLHSDVTYSTAGRELDVNELTVYITWDVFKQKHTWNKLMFWSAD